MKFDLQPVRWGIEVDHQPSAALPDMLSVDVWMDRDLLNPLPIHHHTPNSTESKQNGHPCQQAEMAARYPFGKLRQALSCDANCAIIDTSPANCARSWWGQPSVDGYDTCRRRLLFRLFGCEYYTTCAEYCQASISSR